AAEARQAAEQGGAPQRFASEFARAVRSLDQGNTAVAREEFAQALECYARATQQFLAVRDKARAQVESEQAEAAQREQGRQQAVAVFQRVEQARSAAEQANAQTWFTDEF